jgi:anti-sigma factor RsiW
VDERVTEHVTEAELHAYVDGQLDTAGRVEVEAHLQRHPEAAARVMAWLRLRDEVRLFLADDEAPPATVGLARRLERRLGWRSLGFGLRRGLAAACLVGAGWLAHALLGGLLGAPLVGPTVAASPVPAFVDEAAEADHAVRLELAAGHAPYPALMPLAAPRTGGLVPVPTLRGGLRLLGSDLVPWDGGAAVLAVYDAGGGRVATLFAAEAETLEASPPRASPGPGLATVFWQAGPFAYALSGDLPEADLLAIARAAAPPPRAAAPPRAEAPDPSRPAGDVADG